MKLKLFVKIGELILGDTFSDEKPRADLYLPIWLLAFSMIFIFIGIVLGVMAVVELSIGVMFGAVASLGLGVAALLCWRNQQIIVLSDEIFEYTTFLGNKSTYHFRDITGLKENSDSMTLFVGNKKVHIESCAIVSERLVNCINSRLESIYDNTNN